MASCIALSSTSPSWTKTLREAAQSSSAGSACCCYRVVIHRLTVDPQFFTIRYYRNSAKQLSNQRKIVAYWRQITRDFAPKFLATQAYT